MVTGERILVVAAHPDDEVLGCGGTIAKARRQGHAVRVIFLAEGITSRFSTIEIETPAVQRAIQERNENAVKALDILGVGPEEIFVSLRLCCQLDTVPQLELNKDIEAHLRDFTPTRVYTHAPDDTNIDHRMVHSATMAAIRPVGTNIMTSIYAFEVMSSTEWNPLKPFPATAFVDITKTIDEKISALAAYGGEMRPAPHARSEQALRGLAAYRGAQAGLMYAEAFCPIRTVE